jgi:hypothetical protein
MNVEGLYMDQIAARINRTCLEYLELAVRYPAIFAGPQSDGSFARIRRWLDANEPSADLSRLMFYGDDSVRALVSAVLRRLPAPVAWYASEYVTWLEVGRNARAWQGSAPALRAPIGDVAHVVVINGCATDEYLEGVIAHELGHGWHRIIREHAVPPPSWSDHEQTARHLSISLDAEACARALVSEERRADLTATAWGFLRHTDEVRLLRGFRSALDAAAALAADISRQAEADLASRAPEIEAQIAANLAGEERAAAALTKGTP